MISSHLYSVCRAVRFVKKSSRLEYKFLNVAFVCTRIDVRSGDRSLSDVKSVSSSNVVPLARKKLLKKSFIPSAILILNASSGK